MLKLTESVHKVVAMIDVPDVERALKWYTSIGFQELNRFEEDGEVNFGMVSFGKAELMLRPETLRPGTKPGPRDVSLWFYTSEVDKLYAQFKSQAVDGEIEFVEEIYDPFYGGREFGIRDLNGYSLYFLQPNK